MAADGRHFGSLVGTARYTGLLLALLASWPLTKDVVGPMGFKRPFLVFLSNTGN